MTKPKITSFPTEIKEYLKFYVYALVDPRDGEIFYVGKGKGDRILSHEKEANEEQETYTAKHKRIQEIEKTGLEVSRHFIRIKISTGAEALAVEQGVIEALRLSGVGLSNLVAGHGALGEGATSFDQVMSDLVAEPMPKVDVPLIIFKLNRFWKYGMSDKQVAELTSGYWNLGKDSRSQAKLAVAVAFGIVRGVYWIKPNSWHNGNRLDPDNPKFWGFETAEAPEFSHLIGSHIRDSYIKYEQTPFRLFLKGYPGKGS
jgi:hypothetical protein